MAINKPIVINEADGCLTEVDPISTSAGAGDAGKLVQTNADGQIDQTLIPGSEVLSLPAGENLTAGDFVYVDGAGEVRLASAAAAGNSAQGFVKDTVLAAASVDVFFEGINSNVSGLTTGAKQFLSDVTPGGSVEAGALPTGTGELVQELGFALSATSMFFEQQRSITRI